ncbi:MAG: hypothetical protein EOL91_11265 [Actinobacteria bacterium]|nr:hypothetical protein [Actinomycetota bacterium]
MSDLRAQLEGLFGTMHLKLGQKLLDRIESGEATAAELNVARQFLKDNGIEGLPKDDNPLGRLSKTLPTFDEGISEADLPQRMN